MTAPKKPARGAKKPSGRGGKVPQGASNAPDAGSIPAARSKQPRKGPTKKPKGAAPAKGAEAAKGIGAALLAAKPVDPEVPLTPEHEAFVTEYLRNGRNGTAAYMSVYPGSTARSAWASACRLLRDARVSARVKQTMERFAQAHEFDRDALFAELVAIVKADPNELMQMRTKACSSCWPDEIVETDDVKVRRPAPYWAEPNPECTSCCGQGERALWIADTTRLSPSARALYAGVHETKEGIKILMHDKLVAAEKIAKILGAYEKDNEQKANPIRDLLAALGGRSAVPVVADPPKDGARA